MGKPAPRYYKWNMIFLLWGAFFLNQGDRQAFNSVISLIQKDLGLSAVQIGAVATIFSIFYGVLVPVAGFAGDVIQKRWVVFLSLFTFSIGTLCTGFAGGLILLVIFRSIATGGGEAFYYPAANSLIGQYHRNSRAQAMAIHQTALYAGIVFGGWLAGWIGQNYGWRASFYIFGSIGIFWALLTVICFRNDRADAATEGIIQNTNQKVPLLEAVRNTCKKPTLYLLSLAFGGMVFVNIGFLTWSPTFLQEKFNLTPANAGFSSMFYHYLLALAGIFIGARVSDRLAHRRKTIRMEMEYLGLLLGAPFIWLSGIADTLWLTYLGLAGFGFFRGVYDSNLFAAMFDFIEPKYRATATGLALSVAFIIGSLAPVLLGWMKDTIGLNIGIASLGLIYFGSSVLVFIATKAFFHRDYCNE